MYHEKWGFMVIFWNFAGVPFVSRPIAIPPTAPEALFSQSYVYSVVYMASHDPSKYKFSNATYLTMFITLLTAYYMYVLSLRNLRNSHHVDDLTSAGIHPCHKKADSRCKLRASSTTAKLSPSFLGELSRTQPLFRPLTGNYFPFSVRYRYP